MTVHITVVTPNGKIVQRYEGNFDASDIEALEASQKENKVLVTSDAVANGYFDENTQTIQPFPQKPDFDAEFDYVSKQYVRKETLAAMQDRVWQATKNVRLAKEFGGFTYAGNVYDSDMKSQARINTAAVSGLDVTWTTKDNKSVSLSSSEVVELQRALAQHVASVHSETQMLRQQIYSADTYLKLSTLLNAIQE